MGLKRSAYIHFCKNFVRGRIAGQTHAPGTILSDVEKPAVGDAGANHRHIVGEDAASTQLHTGGIKSLVTSPSPTEFGYQTPLELPEALSYVPNEPGCCADSTAPNARSQAPQNARRRIRIQRRALMEFLKSFLTPTSMAILVSFPIALVPKLKALFLEVPGDRHTSRSGWAAPARVHPRFNDFRWSGICASRTYMPWLVSGAVALPSKTRVEDIANGRHYVDRHHENAYNDSDRCAYMPRADQSGVHIEGRQGPPTGVHVSALWFVIRRSI